MVIINIFITELDKYKKIGSDLLDDFVDEKNVDKYPDIKKKYLQNAVEFSGKLEDTINQQLRILLIK